MSKIGIIVASSNNNYKLAVQIQDIATQLHYETEIINLVNYNLPLYNTLEEEKWNSRICFRFGYKNNGFKSIYYSCTRI